MKHILQSSPIARMILSTMALVCLSFNAHTQRCTGNDAAGNAAGPGLLGEYFAGYFADNTGFFPSTISATNRSENNLNYTSNNWGNILPPATGSVNDPNNYSARYRGSINITTAGSYTFYLSSDDASYLWLDNAALAYPTNTGDATINNGGLHGVSVVSATVNLTAGQHNIQVQFGENSGGNTLKLEYENTALGIARQVVPTSILCSSIQPLIATPVPTPPPGCACTNPDNTPGKAGLYGEYFNGYFNDNQAFFSNRPAGLTRIDTNLQFLTNAWGVATASAGSASNNDLFSTRWTGSLYIATAGNYTFHLYSDDASYLWLDNAATALTPAASTATINNGGLHSPSTVCGSVYLTRGHHDIKIHYGENYGDNRMRLQYASSELGIPVQTIPSSMYCSCRPSILLPIKLSYFNAIAHNRDAQLVWETETEEENAYFELERSLDGIEWTKIAQLAGAGTSHTPQQYNYTDNNLPSGTIYYRFNQVNIDGTSTYSSVVSVNIADNSDKAFTVYPNPTNGILHIATINDLALERIEILDVMGNLVQVIAPSAGNLQTLDISSLSSGLYIVRLHNAASVLSTRIEKF